MIEYAHALCSVIQHTVREGTDGCLYLVESALLCFFTGVTEIGKSILRRLVNKNLRINVFQASCRSGC